MLAIISTALGTASFIGNAVFVLYAREVLDLSEFGYGVLLVPGAIGGIVGSLIAPRFRRFPLRVTLSCAVLASGAATWLIAATSNPVVAGLLTAVSLGAMMVWNVLTLALRQRLIPNEMLGRVGASYRFLVFLGMPVGAADRRHSRLPVRRAIGDLRQREHPRLPRPRRSVAPRRHRPGGEPAVGGRWRLAVTTPASTPGLRCSSVGASQPKRHANRVNGDPVNEDHGWRATHRFHMASTSTTAGADARMTIHAPAGGHC